MGYIYLITNQITKKQYVGQTIREDIDRRWADHRNLRGIGRYLSSAYKRYGIENFKFQIICICFDEACNQLEEDYIKKFNTLAPNGYNLREGGMNSKQHPDSIKLRMETRKKTLDDRRSHGLPLLPPATEEQKKKLSASLKGKKREKMSDEQKVKISEAYKKIWEERRKNNTFDEHIKKMTKGNGNFVKGGPSPRRKRVGKYDDKGTLLEEYDSTVEAGIKNNISHQYISKVCKGVKYCKTAGGFVWKFL